LPSEISSFVGREDQIDALVGLLGRTRLLSLVGPGGIGKTRLALRIANELTGVHPDGVWLTDLSSVTDPMQIPHAIAASLEVHEQPEVTLPVTLVGHLAAKRTLLVLDNCEHLLDGCATLTDNLLRGCPHLQILTTSREGLGIVGETVWQVPALSVPASAQAPHLDQLRKCEAVQLFVERAVATSPDFRLTAENASCVSQICRRLDGIPLAIELAAARARLLSVQEIASNLDDSFRLLTGGSRTGAPRHRTLSAALDWSYELLSKAERTLFERLSVFAGGWTLEAAERVCAGDCITVDNVLELVGHLVDKSLVAVQEKQDGATRYRLLETVRQYARDRLADSIAEEEVLQRHVDYFIAFGEQACPHLRGGPNAAVWLRRVQGEQENLRCALRWCVDHGDCERGLQLAGAVWRFWYLRGSVTEGREWLRALLDLSRGSEQSPARARALNGAGVLANQQGDYLAALPLHLESLRIWQELGDQESVGRSLNNLGALALHRGDHQQAITLLEEALASARARGDKVGEARALGNLEHCFEDQGNFGAARVAVAAETAVHEEIQDKAGMAGGLSKLGFWALVEGDMAAAAALCERGLGFARELCDDPLIAWACLDLGLVRLHQSDWVSGQALLEESLGLRGYSFADDPTRIPLCLAGLAWIAAAQGKPDRALRVFSAASGLRDQCFSPPHHARGRLAGPPFDARSLERWLPAARAALGEHAAAAACAAGRALSLESAIAEALGVDETSTVVHERNHGALTVREREVVRLLATGASNREVAEELVIAVPTAERHVANILNKLGLRTRAQVAVWAVLHGGVES
jgi:non-specific serine/threonine protein kinase